MADELWIRKLRYRLDDFEATTRRAGLACSLKWRTATAEGRFDLTSSPAAYRIIDVAVRRSGAPGRWMEVHSNGPELLMYLTPVSGGFTVGAEVVALLVELANAREEGIRAGDAACSPLELIVRRFDERGRYVEQVLLTLALGREVDAAEVTNALRTHRIAVRGSECATDVQSSTVSA
jgi:hypothetical protein